MQGFKFYLYFFCMQTLIELCGHGLQAQSLRSCVVERISSARHENEQITYDDVSLINASQQQDTLWQDLWNLTTELYRDLIRTNALYFSGMLPQTQTLHERMLYDVGRYLMQSGQLVGGYIPKLIFNPKLSFKAKVKKGACLISILVILVLLVKECSARNSLNNSKPYLPQEFYVPSPTIQGAAWYYHGDFPVHGRKENL